MKYTDTQILDWLEKQDSEWTWMEFDCGSKSMSGLRAKAEQAMDREASEKAQYTKPPTIHITAGCARATMKAFST